MGRVLVASGHTTMTPIIVLITEGKHESVDCATVRLFLTSAEAVAFCNQKNTGKQKYWTKAEILEDGERVDLMQPQED